MVRAIVGTQFGDEGKGRAIELLAQEAQVIARYQGGANAGHTIYLHGERLVFHLMPSGIIYPHTICVIGNGVALDPEVLINEIGDCREKGIEVKDRLFISLQSHVVMPYHKLIDDPTGRLGTTKRGIGPCYEDKYARRGIRAIDLLIPKALESKLKTNLAIFQSYINISQPKVSRGDPTWQGCGYHLKNNLDFNKIYNQYLGFGKFLAPFIADTALLLNQWIDEGKETLLEGAQGLLLDIDHGTYPFVTSSSSHSGGACTGLGISPTRIDEVIGVTKAYTTRVGNGSLPTRMEPEIEEKIREKGKEYGATTGRPRRCGWLDIPMLRRALIVNSIKQIILTKLDVLDELQEIKICTNYKSGEAVKNSLVDSLMQEIEPVYETVPGWRTPMQDIRKYKDLPPNAKSYIERITTLLEVNLLAICVGPLREHTIKL